MTRRRRADAILKLDADPDLRVKMGLRAHEYALRNLAWPPHAAAFVAQLEAWAAAAGRSFSQRASCAASWRGCRGWS